MFQRRENMGTYAYTFIKEQKGPGACITNCDNGNLWREVTGLGRVSEGGYSAVFHVF